MTTAVYDSALLTSFAPWASVLDEAQAASPERLVTLAAKSATYPRDARVATSIAARQRRLKPRVGFEVDAGFQVEDVVCAHMLRPLFEEAAHFMFDEAAATGDADLALEHAVASCYGDPLVARHTSEDLAEFDSFQQERVLLALAATAKSMSDMTPVVALSPGVWNLGNVSARMVYATVSARTRHYQTYWAAILPRAVTGYCSIRNAGPVSPAVTPLVLEAAALLWNPISSGELSDATTAVRAAVASRMVFA